jgi:putative acetyltransferase
MEIILRHEETQDHHHVREILLEAFPTDAESKLVDALRENGKAIISLVAVNGETVVGHILFSPVSTTPPHKARGIGLAPLAVRTMYQSQGIGSQLCRDGLRLCRELQYDFVVVLGGPGILWTLWLQEGGRLWFAE